MCGSAKLIKANPNSARVKLLGGLFFAFASGIYPLQCCRCLPRFQKDLQCIFCGRVDLQFGPACDGFAEMLKGLSGVKLVSHYQREGQLVLGLGMSTASFTGAECAELERTAFDANGNDHRG